MEFNWGDEAKEMFEMLDAELEFMWVELGWPMEMLGRPWAVHTAMSLRPELLRSDVERLLDEIGWHR
jgi:hypothetical protein